MAVDTYEEFSEILADILSSGSVFGMAKWHRNAIAKMFDGMDRDSVVEQLNMFYACQDPEDLREGELGTIVDLVNAMDVNSEKIYVESKIVFG